MALHRTWLSLIFCLASCTNKEIPSETADQTLKKNDADKIYVSKDTFESSFFNDWYERLSEPLLNLTQEQISTLCSNKNLRIELSEPLSCPESFDLETFDISFVSKCLNTSQLELKLRPNSFCKKSALLTLRQKKGTGFFFRDDSKLIPNTKAYPLLAQLKPIGIGDSLLHIDYAAPNEWIKAMSSVGAVRILFLNSKLNPNTISSLGKIFSNLESPSKFNPQIKFEDEKQKVPDLNPENIRIDWVLPDSNANKHSYQICSLMAGWIDYHLLRASSPKPKNLISLECKLELETPFDALDMKGLIEAGRLPLPFVKTPTRTFLFNTMTDALSPSSLLGLRLDL